MFSRPVRCTNRDEIPTRVPCERPTYSDSSTTSCRGIHCQETYSKLSHPQVALTQRSLQPAGGRAHAVQPSKALFQPPNSRIATCPSEFADTIGERSHISS